MAQPTVMTVRGPVPAGELGITLAHEHLFFRLDCYYSQSEDDPDGTFATAPITPDRLWWLRSHPFNNRVNLAQEDLATAVWEVEQFKAAGGNTIIDVTTIGISPNPAGLVAVSERTGLHIVAGTGYYLATSYADHAAADQSTAALADEMRRALLEGMHGTTDDARSAPPNSIGLCASGTSPIRAGLMGELGVSNPPAPVELRVLAAAAQVQRELGCAINIHPAWYRAGAEVAVRAVEAAGIEPSRTMISHLDVRYLDDLPAYKELARRGYWLSLDTFGREMYYPHANIQFPSDAQRIQVVLGLLEAGFGDRLLLAQDICFRSDLVRYGGHGYAHLLRTLRSRFLKAGVSAATFDSIITDNPRRFLCGE